MAEVTDTAPAVQSSAAILVMTQHLTTKMMMTMMMMMMMTTSSGKMVVGRVEIGKSGMWKSAIAFSHVVAGIHVSAQVQLGTPRGVLEESYDAEPLGGGPPP
jgi:hypothetical protein